MSIYKQIHYNIRCDATLPPITASDGTVIVTAGPCDAMETFYDGDAFDQADAARQARIEGWRIARNGDATCPECRENGYRP